jgi:hypothetical protein
VSEPPPEVKRLGLGPGETDALTSALAHRGALAAIDEQAARRVAERLGDVVSRAGRAEYGTIELRPLVLADPTHPAPAIGQFSPY